MANLECVQNVDASMFMTCLCICACVHVCACMHEWCVYSVYFACVHLCVGMYACIHTYVYACALTKEIHFHLC